jgi:hypothetical protein
MASPLNGARLTNPTIVNVQVASIKELESIHVYNDSMLLGTVSCAGGSCWGTVISVTWHTNNLATGPHSLYAVASDIFGNRSSSTPITVYK